MIATVCVCVQGVTQHDSISQIQEVEGLSGEVGFLLRFLTSAVDFSKSHTPSRRQREEMIQLNHSVCMQTPAHRRYIQQRFHILAHRNTAQTIYCISIDFCTWQYKLFATLWLLEF